MWLDATRIAGSVIAYDGFARANNASGLGAAPSGQAWSAISGTIGINGNAAYGVPTGFYSLTTGISDGSIEFVFTATASMDLRLMPRVINSTNYIRLTITNTQLQFVSVVAGTSTQFGIGSQAFTAGQTYVLRIDFKGSTYAVYLNNATAAVLTATDSGNNHLNAVAQGFAINAGTPTVTNFNVSTTRPADGDTIPAWPDVSTPASYRAATQATVANRPLFKAAAAGNGLPSVLFDGSNDILTTGIPADGASQTILVACQLVALPGASGALIASTTGGMEFRITSTGALQGLKTNTSTLGTSVEAVPIGVPMIVAFSYSADGTFQMYINGRPTAPADYSGRNAVSFTAGTMVTIGGVGTAAENVNAYVFDVIRYNRTLRGDEILQLTLGLAEKNKITPAPRLQPPRRRFADSLIIKGASIHPKSSYSSDPASVWTALWNEWDWTNWIKKSIDLSKGQGVNTFRIIGGIGGIFEGRYTRTAYLARLQQLVEYLQQQGMYMYACGGDIRHLERADGSFVKAELVTQANLLKNYDNVIGFDLMNELGATFNIVGQRQALGWAKEWASAVKATAPNIPLTYSQVSTRLSDYDTYREMDRYCDFHDVHLYPTPTAQMGNHTIAPLLAMTDKQILIGEFGANRGSMTAPQMATAFGQVLGIVQSHEQVIGASLWAAIGNSYGLYDETTVTLQSDVATPFASFPAALATP